MAESDPTMYRQTANALARIAGTLTEKAFDGGDMEHLQQELGTLRAAADICRRTARKTEARQAQLDATAPLCLGCKHRKDGAGGLDCEQGLDTREATTRRQCKRYEAE